MMDTVDKLKVGPERLKAAMNLYQEMFVVEPSYRNPRSLEVFVSGTLTSRQWGSEARGPQRGDLEVAAAAD